MPRVFISYSWDSDEHKDRVRSLATFLRRNGIDARLDQWEEGTPPDGWPAWCSRQVIQADVIAIICTKRYHSRFHGLESRRPGGVIWESQTIQKLAYFHYLRAGFLPVILNDTDGEYVPACVLGAVVQPLVWPTDGDWSGSGILDRLDAGGGSTARQPLPMPETKKSAGVAVDQEPSVIDKSVWEGIARIQQRIEILAEQIQQPYRPRITRPPKYRSESSDPSLQDLRYDERWLDYQATPELNSLQRWIADPAPFTWWAVIAPGGTGKSRLALELIDSLDEKAWDAAFLTDSLWLRERCRGWRPRRATLLVVDYASAKQDEVLEGLQTLTDTLKADYGFPKVRMLLLDRSSGFTPRFAAPQTGLADWNTIRKHVRTTLFVPTEKAPVALSRINTAVPPLVEREEMIELGNPSRVKWPSILHTAMRKAMGPANRPCELPPLSDTAWWANIARLTADGRILYLELLGVTLTREPDFIGGLSEISTREAILDAMIDHERATRWPAAWPMDRGGPQKASTDPRFKAVVHAIGFATLVRGMPIATLADWKPVTQATALPEDCRILLREYLRVETHPQPTRSNDPPKSIVVIQPLEPDLLGERLLLTLSTPARVGMIVRPAEIDPLNWIAQAMHCNPIGTTQTISLITEDFSDHPATKAWVAAAASFLAADVTVTQDDFPAQATAAGLAKAVGQLATLSLLDDELLNNVRAFADSSEPVQESLLEGVLRLAYRACEVKTDQWDQLAYSLAWGSNENRTAGAKAAVNAIGAYGKAKRFIELERWGSALRTTVDNPLPTRDVHLSFVQAAVNAVNAYGDAGWFDSLEQWAKAGRQVADHCSTDTEIQIAWKKLVFNVITDYGAAGDFPSLERWADILLDSTSPERDDRDTHLLIAKAAVNAILAYSRSERISDVTRWVELLRAECETFPEDEELRLALTKGLANGIRAFREATEAHTITDWMQHIQSAASRYPDNKDLQLQAFKAAFHAVAACGNSGDLAEMPRWAACGLQAIKRSEITPELMNEGVALAVWLTERAPDAAATLLGVLADYWPGFRIVLPDNKHTFMYMTAAWPEEKTSDCHTTRVEVSRLFSLLADTPTASATEATQILRELWPLRMYLADRGDSLVPALEMFHLDDLVAEAAQDPWRSPGALT